MKGIFNLAPPQSKYTRTYDVNKTFAIISQFFTKPRSYAQINAFTELLTILAGRRLCTLQMLNVNHIDTTRHEVILHIVGLTKCSSLHKQTDQ